MDFRILAPHPRQTITTFAFARYSEGLSKPELATGSKVLVAEAHRSFRLERVPCPEPKGERAFHFSAQLALIGRAGQTWTEAAECRCHNSESRDMYVAVGKDLDHSEHAHAVPPLPGASQARTALQTQQVASRAIENGQIRVG